MSVNIRLLAIAGLAVVAMGPLSSCSTLGAPVQTSANALSGAEKAAGWRLLFNGKDLTGWRGYRKPDAPQQWQVEDGALTLTQGGGGDLITTDEFGPFELSFDWKISPGGNSGVIYLVKEVDAAPNTYNTGPEYQVLDNDKHADGKLPSHRAGALYDLVAPPDGAGKPVGEWNAGRILVKDGRIEHWLNGRKVAEAPYGDAAWKALVAQSKFKTMPFFGVAASGHIALQDHGNRVWYRNIKVRRL